MEQHTKGSFVFNLYADDVRCSISFTKESETLCEGECLAGGGCMGSGCRSLGSAEVTHVLHHLVLVMWLFTSQPLRPMLLCLFPQRACTLCILLPLFSRNNRL